MNPQKLPKRKEIRLKSYDYNSDGYYFVTICTDFKKPFFQSEKAKTIVVAEFTPLLILSSKLDHYGIKSKVSFATTNNGVVH